MQTSIWNDYLIKKLNRKIHNANRKILLLIDNAPTHNLLDIELTNVVIHYSPPNTTAYLQPLDAGIIHSFKV